MGMNVLVVDMVLGQVLVVGGRRRGCCAACNPGSGSSGRGLGLNRALSSALASLGRRYSTGPFGFSKSRRFLGLVV